MLGELRLKEEMIPESSDNDLIAAMLFTLVLALLAAAILAARYVERKRDVLHGRFIDKGDRNRSD